MTANNDKLHKHIIYKSPNTVDKILSKELLQLSLKDRNAADEEIHGVTTMAPAETPDFLEASLHRLSKELSKIPDDSPIKASYLESQILPVTYVNTRDFRLRFLRCDLFDAKKAAIRMVKFLDFASHLFGPIVLKQPMKMTDFTNKEKKWMQNYQILPFRDQSGRQIRAWVGDFEASQVTPVSLWRIILYIRYCMSEDIETQRKGYVGVNWARSASDASLPVWEHYNLSKKLIDSSPIRKCSGHWCMPPNLPLTHPLHFLRASYTLALHKEKSRVKFHIGNRVELMYELKSYGIPVEWIPITETGTIKTAYLKQWIRGRNHIENVRDLGMLDDSSIIVCPMSRDVIFRTGTAVRHHPGNVVFDGIIESRLQKHFFATQEEKRAITKAIIDEIQQQGGRFLTWDKRGWWEELKDDSKIHARVASKVRIATDKTVAGGQAFQSSTFVFSNQDNRKRRKLSSPEGDSGGGRCGSEGISCFGQHFNSVG